jgi:hypothetical protein
VHPGLLSIIRHAADEANTLAGESFLYEGRKYSGTFGRALTVEIPMPTGGYRRRAELTLSVPLSQSTFSPTVKKRITRLSPRHEYVIDRIDDHDPINVNLVLVKLGE